MKTEEYIQRVCSKIKGQSTDIEDDSLSNFLLFDENFDGCLQVNSIVTETISPIIMLEKILSEIQKEQGIFSEEEQKKRFFKRYYFTNYAVSLKANQDNSEMFNVLEFLPSKQVRFNQDLINKVLDFDEILLLKENPESLNVLNKKYNANFGEIIFYMNFHLLNLRTKQSNFFSSEMILGLNENLEFGEVKQDNTNFHLFEVSISSYKECLKELYEFKKNENKIKSFMDILKKITED